MTSSAHARRVVLGDLEVVYEDAGSSGPSRPFVLVHGFSGCRRDFDPVLPELAALGRTLVPDLRGHGESSHAADPQRYSFATLVDDLRGFLDALGVSRCDLLGHSMGGMLALRFVLAHPQRVASLVLMDTTPRELEGIPRPMLEKAGAIARSAGMATLQRIFQSRLQSDPERSRADARIAAEWGERYWEHHRRRFLPMDAEAYARLGPAMYDEPPVTPRLGVIRCPTLVMVGEQDRNFLAGAALLEQGIPGALRVTIRDADHHPQRENPKAWLDAVQAHLRRARGSES